MSTLPDLAQQLIIRFFMLIPCPLAITSEDLRYIKVNPAFSDMLGYQEHEVIGRSPAELNLAVDPEQLAAVYGTFMIQSSIRDIEMKVRTKDNTILNGKITAEWVEIEGSRLILIVMEDISQEKRLEAEILRLDNLKLIGQMAAGISHEVRNPLTTVRGYLQLLSRKPDCVQHKSTYQLLISELDRANDIITKFLSVSRNTSDTQETKLWQLNDILLDLKPLLEAKALESGNDLLYELSEIPQLRLNAKEIRQLILNLTHNGFDAMPAKGTLNVRTCLEGNQVILAVQDEGEGIDPSIIGKLGSPFFSTKDTGTGLGLSVCYGIAQRHSAEIHVATASTGTTFLVRFPVQNDSGY